MRHRLTSLIAPLLAALTLSACAPSIKEHAVNSVQVAHTAANTAQDAEIALWDSGAMRQRWTVEKRQAYHAALVKYYDAEKKVLTVLRAWRSGDPAPSDLSSALAALEDAIAVVGQVGPDGMSALLTPLSQAIAQLRAVAALFQRT